MNRMPTGWRGKKAWMAVFMAAAALAIGAAAAPGATRHRAAGSPDEFDRAPTAAGSLTVMSYNVEGLPAPARFGRSGALDRIGDGLAQLRRQRRQPNVVLLQEAFATEAGRIADRAGYRYTAEGPAAGDLNPQRAPADADRLVAGASHFKGEDDGKWIGSGLRILSDYPIAKVERLAFPSWACAGYDCLANKGAVIAWIAIPGAAEPVAFIDTHLNSRAASGVAKNRADMAYAYQILALRQFIASKVASSTVAFLGGDFNTGKALVRKADLGLGLLSKGRNSLLDALAEPGKIAPPDGPDATAILQRGKDWLFYRGNSRCPVALTGFDVPFGRAADGNSLSDHLGYEAHYRLGQQKPNERARCSES